MLIPRGIGKDQIIVPPKLCAIHKELKGSKFNHEDGDKNETKSKVGCRYLNHRVKRKYYLCGAMLLLYLT